MVKSEQQVGSGSGDTSPVERSVLEELRQKWEVQALEQARPINPDSLEQPQRSIKNELLKERIIDLLDQRNEQRKHIFELAKRYCWTSLLFLIAIVYVQILGRALGDRDFSIFDGNELQIIVIGVFGQFVGLLYIITKSLYDDKNYKEMFKHILKR